MNRSDVTPWPGSPFLSPDFSGPTLASDPVVQDMPDLETALVRLAKPNMTIGIIHWPPLYPEANWFYGSDQDDFLSGLRRTDEGYQVSSPILKEKLVTILETALAPQEPWVTDGFALSLSRDGFITLSAIVDLIQEGVMVTALNRQPPIVQTFGADDLYHCFHRGDGGLDLRWMAQRIKFLSPVPIKPDRGCFESGLKDLEQAKMLIRDNFLFQPTPRFHTACSLLGACSGFSAMATRILLNKSTTWVHQHVAALRGLGSLWLMDFSDISNDDFVVKLGDITPSLLHERLLAGVHVNNVAPGTTARSTSSGTTQLRTCPECGLELMPETEICPVCAKKNKSVSAPEPSLDVPPRVKETAVGQLNCPECGITLPVGTKFCTQCGKPGRPSATDSSPKIAPAQLNCTKCKAPLTPKMKFCTHCGTPTAAAKNSNL